MWAKGIDIAHLQSNGVVPKLKYRIVPFYLSKAQLFPHRFDNSTIYFCVFSDKDCIVGIVSHAVLLPCYHHNELLSFHNLSVEWRRGNELVLKAKWEEDGDVVIWSLNHATIPRNAPLTGNFSLELPKLSAKEDQMVYSLFVTSVENGSNNRTVFLCHSSGGFPKPTVYWLINDTEQPPEDSVWTDTTPLPDSSLYNVTSLLTVNISTDDSVSCSIQNQWMNETLTSKSREFVSFTGLFIRWKSSPIRSTWIASVRRGRFSMNLQKLKGVSMCATKCLLSLIYFAMSTIPCHMGLVPNGHD
uniref:Ig-like domain-containing protein n=1 Tax=Periophthalmus magnuspinnatus TaxID=409849 RepID=A0A3B4BB29_9GOBI